MAGNNTMPVGIVKRDYPIIIIPTDAQEKALHAKWGENPAQRFRLRDCSEVYISDTIVHLPGIGDVKFATKMVKKDRPMGDIESVEIYKSRDEKYHATIRCLVREPEKLPLAKDTGLDIPADGYALDAEGRFCVGEKYQSQELERLRDLQLRMARKAKGRDNWVHLHKLVQKANKHIKDQRKTHKAQLLSAARKEAKAAKPGQDKKPGGKRPKKVYPVSPPEQKRRDLQKKKEDGIRDMMCADCNMDPSCPGWRRTPFCPLM